MYSIEAMYAIWYEYTILIKTTFTLYITIKNYKFYFSWINYKPLFKSTMILNISINDCTFYTKAK